MECGPPFLKFLKSRPASFHLDRHELRHPKPCTSMSAKSVLGQHLQSIPSAHPKKKNPSPALAHPCDLSYPGTTRHEDVNPPQSHRITSLQRNKRRLWRSPSFTPLHKGGVKKKKKPSTSYEGPQPHTPPAAPVHTRKSRPVPSDRTSHSPAASSPCTSVS